MTDAEREEKKKKFIHEYALCKGIVSIACDKVPISRSAFYLWCEKDSAFKVAVKSIEIAQKEHVESKLLAKIDEGDTTAIIFYLKTKGKDLGYSEKTNNLDAKAGSGCSIKSTEGSSDVKQLDNKKKVHTERMFKSKVENEKQKIVNRLKKQGRYTPMLDQQIKIASTLLVRGSMLMSQISSEAYSPILVEYSREGNTRMSVNPIERLYLDVEAQAQKALRALGMNTDSKEVVKNESSDKIVSLLEGVKSIGED